MSWITDTKVWRTILVNALALAPIFAGFLPGPYGALVLALANVVNHAYNSQTASAPAPIALAPKK